MVKRIPCKVISTSAFNETSAGVSSGNHQYKGSATVDIGFKHIDNTKSFNVGLGIRDGFPVGQILDFYA